MGYWVSYIVILGAGLIIGIGLIALAHRYWPKPAENIALSVLALFITFMAAELFFAFYAQTDARGYTLASQNWYKRYWSVNSMGYRDVEWPTEGIQKKRKILVLGDSFAAGSGIENIEDRFSNLLNSKLGDDYLVMNIAQVGLSTDEELNEVMGFPYKPEILIFQYYINDIQNAAKADNERYTVPKTYPWPILDPLVRNSYALNFIWWRLAPLGPRTWDEDYLSWVKRVYNDPEIWWLHQQELLTIHSGAAAEGVELIVVVFPALTDIEGSREVTAKVAGWFEERGVPTLDVTEFTKDKPTGQLVENSFDAHPSSWVHQQVADKLYDMIMKLESETKNAK